MSHRKAGWSFPHLTGGRIEAIASGSAIARSICIPASPARCTRGPGPEHGRCTYNTK